MDRIPFELFTESHRFLLSGQELTKVWRHKDEGIVFATNPEAIIVCDESLVGEQLGVIYDSPPHDLVEIVRNCHIVSRSLDFHSSQSQMVDIPEIIKPKDVDEHWVLDSDLIGGCGYCEAIGEHCNMEPIQLGNSVIELESKDTRTVSKFSERNLWPITQIKRKTFCYLTPEELERNHYRNDPAARLLFYFNGGYGIVMPRVPVDQVDEPLAT